ncbi:hypothetical protein RGQ15_19760 [Paracoccus sp. MBLB3053]|uniref:Uncharacterized protein n=1 Tax=Paracoccus aurantius TaxID=3073814 RepID=A0ABU2HXL1_9RHOB|nr:hypothetical protein [Paracoccus sp. MBLB3053]MDS9469799.1 hypothetical protein [Paracoccus sp. MBLB3053]
MPDDAKDAIQDATEAEARFQALWTAANESPVRYLETGEDEEIDTAGAFGAWIREIADACREGGLIDEADHAEMQQCGDTVAKILGKVSPEALRARLTSLGPEDPISID